MVRELAITPDVLRLVEDDTGANPAVVNPLREMVYRRCVADFEFFVSTFWQVPVVGKGYRQWDLYDYQRSEARVLQELQRLGLQGESTREIRLKARQVGFTTEATAFTFWSAFFHPDLPWLISSRTEDDAQLALAEKVVAPMQRLPQWLLARGPKVSTQNADELSFDNGSGITSIPASSGAGRSRAVFGVLVDEYAFVEDQDSLFAALDPLCYGMMIVFSTANGMGNNFHSLWVDAAASDSIWNATSKRLRPDERWHGTFVPWHAVPGRDEKWYEARKRSYRAKPWVFYQEFPASDGEAFSRSGRMAWPDELITAQPWAVPDARYDFSLFDLGREPRTLEGAERLMPQQEADLELWVWEPPTIERDRTGRVVRPPNYVIGVDTSEGLDHGDRTSIVVGNANTGEIVATLLGTPFLEDIGRMVEWLGYLYHTALIVIERNNTGLVPNEFLAQANYPRLYRLNPHETGRPRYGFHTTSASKPALVAAMGKALRDDAVVLHDERFLLEARMFVADGRGGFSAIKGRHDDHVMGHLLCLHGMEFAGSYPVTFVDKHGPPTLGDIFGYAHERSLGVGESPLDVPIRPKSPIG